MWMKLQADARQREMRTGQSRRDVIEVGRNQTVTGTAMTRISVLLGEVVGRSHQS